MVTKGRGVQVVNEFGISRYILLNMGVPSGSVIKNHLPMQETQVQSLGQEDPLEWRRPTPEFLSGKSHGQRSLAGYTVHGVTKE